MADDTRPAPSDALELARAAKEQTVALFDRTSATYDDVGVEFFATFGRRLVQEAGLRPGQHVLDVGCGRGAVLFPAAEAVTASGSVLGIDLAPGMIERTAAEVAARGLTHVQVRLGDAEAPDVHDASVDVVLSGLVIFFLPDPGAALDAYRAALVAGGVFAMSTFGAEDGAFATVFGAIAGHIPVPDDVPDPPRPTTAARAQEGPFTSSSTITALLESRGFVSVENIEVSYDIEFADGEHWIQWSWSHGARRLWEMVPEDRRDAARADALRALDGLATSGGTLSHPWVLRYTTAHTPS